MAKAVVLEVIEQVIGRYVLNLDSKSLSVGLWKGLVELNSLQLNKAEINKELSLFAENSPNFTIPIRIIDGSCENISLKIPWFSLSSKPVIFRVRDLRIVVEPYDHLSQKPSSDTLSAREESIIRRDVTRKNVNKLKAMSLLDEGNPDKDSSNKNRSFSRQLIKRIVENLQIEIRNIHVEVKGHDFNAGVHLGSLALITTDEKGNRTFVDRAEQSNSDFLFKELNLSELRVSLERNNEISNLRMQSRDKNILGPLSFTAKLCMADDKVVSPYVPKYHLRFNLPILSIQVSKNQIETIMEIYNWLVSHYLSRPLFPEYRPNVPISKKSAVLWWKYAFRCVGRVSHRTSWKELLIAFQKRKTYILLYKRHAYRKEVPTYKKLSPEEYEKLIEIENDRTISIKGIMLWRNIADAVAQIDKRKATQSRPQKTFFSLFKTSKTKKSDDNDSLVPLSIDDIKRIESASLEESDQNMSDIKNYKMFDLDFVIGEVDVTLLESQKQPIIFCQVKTLQASFDAESDGSYEFKTIVDSFIVKDLGTVDTTFPIIVKSSNAVPNLNGRLAENYSDDSRVLSVELLSASDGAFNIIVDAKSFEVVLHPNIITKITTLFSTRNEEKQKKDDIELFSNVSESRSGKLYQSIAKTLRERINKGSSVNVIVNFDAPVVLLPVDLIEKHTSVLVFNLGSFVGCYGPDVAVPSLTVSLWFQSKATQQNELAYYYTISASDISLKLYKSIHTFEQPKQTLCDDLCNAEDILSPINFDLSVGIGSGESLIGKICTHVVIKEIGIQFSTPIIYDMTSILTLWILSLQNPKEDMMENSRTTHLTKYSESFRGKASHDDVSTDCLNIDDTTENSHFSFELRRFSISLAKSKLESLTSEMTHLEASFTFNNNDTSIYKMRLRTFWICDGLQVGPVRRDRIVAHSRLPISHLILSGVDQKSLRTRLDEIIDEVNDSNVIDIIITSFPQNNDFEDDLSHKSLSDFQSQVNMSFLGLSLDINISSIFEILGLLQDYKENYFRAVFDMTSKKEEQELVLSDAQNIKSSLKQTLNESNTSLSITSSMSLFDFSISGGETEKEIFRFEIHDVMLKYAMISKEEQSVTTLDSHVGNIICKTGAIEYLPEPIQLFGKASGARINDSGRDKLIAIKIIQTNQNVQVDTDIGEIEMVCFPELYTLIYEVLQFKQYEREISPDHDILMIQDEIKQKESTKIDDKRTFQDTVKRTLQASVTMRKIRLTIFAVPPGFKTSSNSVKIVCLSSSDGVIIETAFIANAKLKQNMITNSIEKANVDMSLTALEIYSTEGLMKQLTQILDPVDFSLEFVYRFKDKVQVDVEMNFSSCISFDVSMNDIDNLNRTARSFKVLKSNVAKGQNIVSSADETGEDTKQHNDQLAQSENISLMMKLSIPGLNITLINDVLGIDEPIFKIVFDKTTLQAEVLTNPVELGGSKGPFFLFQINSLINADSYFSAIDTWQPLMLEPSQIEVTGSRGLREDKMKSNTLTSIGINIESFHFLLADQFLLNIASAMRMLKIYTTATNRLSDEMISPDDTSDDNMLNTNADKMLTYEQVKTLLKLPPYELTNRTGFKIFFQVQNSIHQEECDTGKSCSFTFEYCRGNGHGGKRAYGQDLKYLKKLTIYLQNQKIVFHHLDDEINESFRVHHLDSGPCIFSCVQKSGNKTILCLRTSVDVINSTSIPIDISVDKLFIGTITRFNNKLIANTNEKAFSSAKTGKEDQDETQCVGIPCNLLNNNTDSDHILVNVEIAPKIPNLDQERTSGSFCIPSLKTFQHCSDTMSNWTINEVTCLPLNFTLQVMFKLTKTKDDSIIIDVFIQPKAILYNRLPVTLSIRTHHGIIYPQNQTLTEIKGSPFVIFSDDAIEIFSPCLSDISLEVKCHETGTGGYSLGSLNISKFPSLNESTNDDIFFNFPLVDKDGNTLIFKGATCFISRVKNMFLSEHEPKAEDIDKVVATALPADIIEFPLDVVPENIVQTFQLKVSNIAVDHTCNVLFQPVDLKDSVRATLRLKSVSMCTYSAFWSPNNLQKITMLPDTNSMIRIIFRDPHNNSEISSQPFFIKEIVLKEGGVDFTRIPMTKSSKTAIYAYRKLSRFHEHVLHIIYEYKIFNYSTDKWFSFKYQDGRKITVLPSNTVPIFNTENITFHLIGSDYVTDTINIRLGSDSLVLKSKSNGNIVGKMSIDTVLAEQSSCFVIKIGKVVTQKDTKSPITRNDESSFWRNDYLRLSFKWQKLHLSLCNSTFKSGEGLDRNMKTLKSFLMEHTKMERSQQDDDHGHEQIRNQDEISSAYSRIAYVCFDDINIDFQRIFKVSETTGDLGGISQLRFILNKLIITDCTMDTSFPVVIDTSDHKSSFVDLKMQIEESDSNNVNINAIDLKLWGSGNKDSDRVKFRTSEQFVWALLDFANGIFVALADLNNIEVELQWNDKKRQYETSISSVNEFDHDNIFIEETYKTSSSQGILRIDEVVISPLAFEISFKRYPDVTRYQNTVGATFFNYFVNNLKFTINKAKLNLPGYKLSNFKGPANDFFSLVKTFYKSELSFKILTLLSAATIQEWDTLAGREGGSKDYVEGDGVRMIGNVVGKSAEFLLKGAGKGLGTGIGFITSTIGSGVKYGATAVGGDDIGKEINEDLNGLGKDIGDAVEGVGEGTGKILYGLGKGVGKAAGGLGGGLLLVAQGKTEEAGQAVTEGFEGGYETITTEAGDGGQRAKRGCRGCFGKCGNCCSRTCICS